MADKHITQDDDVLSALPEGQTTTHKDDPADKPAVAPRKLPKEDLVPSINFDTGSALDALFSQSTKSAADDSGGDDDAKHSDGAAAADDDGDSADDKNVNDKKDDKDAKANEKAAKADDKKVDDKKVDDKAAAATKDILDSVELPPQAKARSGEAFAKVKELARQQIKERDDNLSKLTAEVEQLRKDVANRPPAEAAKELEDLRNWRNQIDVEADPKWKEQFDGRIAKNVDQIYAKLKENGMSDAKIEDIKKMGGPEALDWEPILPKMSPQLRRFIETKLVENESLSEDRKASVAAAKEKAGEFLKERSSAHEALTKKDREKSQVTVDGLLKKLPWWGKEHTIPADATPEQKADIEAEIKFAADSKNLVKELLENRSPEMFGEMVVGTVLAHRYHAELVSLRAASDAALKKLEADLKTATDELNRIKKSTSGRRESSAPAKSVPRTRNIFEPASEALDRLRAELDQG